MPTLGGEAGSASGEVPRKSEIFVDKMATTISITKPSATSRVKRPAMIEKAADDLEPGDKVGRELGEGKAQLGEASDALIDVDELEESLPEEHRAGHEAQEEGVASGFVRVVVCCHTRTTRRGPPFGSPQSTASPAEQRSTHARAAAPFRAGPQPACALPARGRHQRIESGHFPAHGRAVGADAAHRAVAARDVGERSARASVASGCIVDCPSQQVTVRSAWMAQALLLP